MGARPLALAALGCLIAGGASAACPELPAAVGEAAGEGHRVAYRLDPSPVPLAAPFALEIVACGPAGPFPGPLEVDADMPAHRHGMNYAPRVAPEGEGRFRVEGMLFHMPGDWRIKFVLRTEAGPVRLSAPYALE